MDGSGSGFCKMGMMAVVLIAEGTRPEFREELTSRPRVKGLESDQGGMTRS